MDKAYIAVYIIVGVFGIIGVGGLLGILKHFKLQVVRDDKIDRMIDGFFGDRETFSIAERLDQQDEAIEAIKNQVTPNGGETGKLGDTIKRTEIKVDNAIQSFSEHIDRSTKVEDELRGTISAISTTLKNLAFIVVANGGWENGAKEMQDAQRNNR